MAIIENNKTEQITLQLGDVEQAINDVKKDLKDLLTHLRGIAEKKLHDKEFLYLIEEKINALSKDIPDIEPTLTVNFGGIQCSKLGVFTLFPTFAKTVNGSSYMILPICKKPRVSTHQNGFRNLCNLLRNLFLRTQRGSVVAHLQGVDKNPMAPAKNLGSWVIGLPRSARGTPRSYVQFSITSPKTLPRVNLQNLQMKSERTGYLILQKDLNKLAEPRRASPFVVFADVNFKAWRLIAFLSLDWPSELFWMSTEKRGLKVNTLKIDDAYKTFLVLANNYL